MCKLQSFMSSKQQLFTVCAFTMCSKCLPLAFTHDLSPQCHCLVAESVTDWFSCSLHSSTTHSCNSPTFRIFFFVHSLFRHSSCSVRKHFTRGLFLDRLTVSPFRGAWTQIWPYFQLQRSVMSSPSGVKTNVNRLHNKPSSIQLSLSFLRRSRVQHHRSKAWRQRNENMH